MFRANKLVILIDEVFSKIRTLTVQKGQAMLTFLCKSVRMRKSLSKVKKVKSLYLPSVIPSATRLILMEADGALFIPASYRKILSSTF